jgi:hypothetical protein
MRCPKPSIFLLLVNGTMAVLLGLMFRPSYSPLVYLIQGHLHDFPDHVCKFTVDYDDNVISIAIGTEA